MSFKTGLHRLALFIKGLGVAAGALCLLLAATAFSDGEGWYMVVVGVILGGLLWAIGWVVDGFSKE